MTGLTQGELLGALRTVATEFLTNLEKRSIIRTAQEQPQPSAEEEVEPKLRAAFNQIDANGKVLNAVCVTANVNVKQLANHAKQLAGLTKQVDDLCKEPTGATLICSKLNEHTAAIAAADKELAKLTKRMDEIGTEHCDMHSQIRFAVERLDALAPAPKPEPVRDDKGASCNVCTSCQGLGFIVRHAEPAQESKPACEHPESMRGEREMCIGRANGLAPDCECGALQLNGIWFIPERPHAKPDEATDGTEEDTHA